MRFLLENSIGLQLLYLKIDHIMGDIIGPAEMMPESLLNEEGQIIYFMVSDSDHQIPERDWLDATYSFVAVTEMFMGILDGWIELSRTSGAS